MKTLLIAAATAFALSGGVAFAAGEGGGNGAIANSTTTSMGAPEGSPGMTAPRSEAVPGVAPQQRLAQEQNAQNQHTDQGVMAPVQGPKNPMTGNTQVTR